ncbi:RdgB/HAM1 family non-canonical purine NTP pyrophosphatase [Legionella israelensis]|uniref:dITP/XTP pyrophosphatase n=1 Tax=Legionella israelensis TaxID=454 RepID=A0A0W0V2E5_9GAMM|nr:RdgB/HAM1 family non-canonical purine NTP pyrophosphatase [Legionella israelensis]KTD14273.1 deoxyribonucleotide triphosphate pyrophosphatase [Legionella israelensis]QBR84625.1 RdgB/HAM1 family non-canonical purine NTP pyrophosphatase [Legionella israelensis]QBS10569.1 RdgB/HAM1 family non-canonical purine NTP pyrophosphatase [Legionella israelensis]QDP72253.1 RdgB/HAM1 family non-canonical purine NTP pyrophosphatase [Legionella israelensis]SCX93615.1 XTP/dITP diphosphohydrolase [Legionella
MKELILATGNKGKISELTALLAPIKCIQQVSLGIPEAKETGATFIENALLKARHASSLSHRPALADDSGLVVHALQGEPGIYSARYAGKDATNTENIKKLLKQLEDTPDEQRSAYFYCAIVLIQHASDPAPLIATGKLNGFITRQPAGSEGFGYDPVFYIPSQECTAAQLPSRIKNSISHRAQALAKLREQL